MHSKWEIVYTVKKNNEKSHLEVSVCHKLLEEFSILHKNDFQKNICNFSSVIIMFMYACKNKHFQLNEFLAKKSHNLYGIISNHRCQCHWVSMHYSHTELRESLFMLTHCHPQSWKFDSTSAKFVSYICTNVPFVEQKVQYMRLQRLFRVFTLIIFQQFLPITNFTYSLNSLQRKIKAANNDHNDWRITFCCYDSAGTLLLRYGSLICPAERLLCRLSLTKTLTHHSAQLDS